MYDRRLYKEVKEKKLKFLCQDFVFQGSSRPNYPLRNLFALFPAAVTGRCGLFSLVAAVSALLAVSDSIVRGRASTGQRVNV